MHKNSNDICGHVLEIGDPGYTNKYGGSCVTISDVLHVQPGNSKATIIGNLETGEGITEDTFDCIILTETLHVIYDFRAAIANTYLALKPGGVLLVTFPGISQISRYDMDRWGDYWRFTSLSAQRLFAEVFPAENITVEAHGNVLVAISFLHGLAVQELSQEEFDYYDPNYQLSITIRAVKPKIQS
ncbi:MAG: methyltransferase domain-containing protein [Anaerolineales bacterium]|nr:methyltransferase domain-containing protein [Anaerolineales bacterium]